MAKADDLEKELDAIQSNWPANRPSIKDEVRRQKSQIKEDLGIISEKVSDNSDRPTEFKYIDENVVGRETFFNGPFGERQGKWFISRKAETEFVSYRPITRYLILNKDLIQFISGSLQPHKQRTCTAISRDNYNTVIDNYTVGQVYLYLPC